MERYIAHFRFLLFFFNEKKLDVLEIDCMIYEKYIYREMNKRMTEEKAKKDYELTLKMEQEFGEYLTGKELI